MTRIALLFAAFFFAAFFALDTSAGTPPGEGVVVALVGSGVQHDHPLLGGVPMGPGSKVRGGYDFVDGDPDPTEPVLGRGTVMAVLVAASSPTFRGVAPAASLLAYRAKTDAQVAEAIARAVQDGAHVIVVEPMGFTGQPDGPTPRAVDNAVGAGVVVVAAAGWGFNDNGGFSLAATAEKAITVGDDFHGGDRASARGPTMVTMRFKPDVVAEHLAFGIPGLPSVFGTEVAAARVAGMCAVLREAHPKWTPLEIKSAITTTATPVFFLQPLEGGSGKANLQGALEATAFVNKTGLMFGIHPATNGSGVVTQSVTIQNRAATAQTFALRSESTWPIRQSVEPRSMTIPAGASATARLKLTLDYALLPFPDSFSMGGVLHIEGGSSSLRVPWALMRGARVSVVYDLAPTWPVTVFDALKGIDWVFPWSPGRAELWVKPGQYDFIIAEKSFVPPFDVRLVIAEKQSINFDDWVTLRRATATIPIASAGVDERGVPFRSRPDGYHHKQLHVAIKDHGEVFLDSFLLDSFHPAGTNVLVSPTSERVTFIAAETYVEPQGRRVYSLMHEPQHGIREPRTFTNDPDAYVRATIERDRESLMSLCLDKGYVKSLFIGQPSCLKTFTPTVEFLAAGDNEFVHHGLYYQDEVLRSPKLRLYGGELVLTDPRWWIPDPMAPRVEDHSTIRFGAGPVRAGLHIAGSNAFSKGAGGGYYGALGEYLSASASTTWNLFDANGGTVESGGDGEPVSTWSVEEGFVYVETNNALRSVTEVRLGRIDELDGTVWFSLPSVSAIRTRDGSGSITDVLAQGGSATIEFAARNFMPFEWTPEIEIRPEATRLAWRRSGTTAWQSLTPVLTGSEHGDPDELGHNPLGEMYRADLTGTLGTSGPVDLKIEIVDVNGTHTTWTQTSAFVVAAVPGKRRSVAH